MAIIRSQYRAIPALALCYISLSLSYCFLQKININMSYHIEDVLQSIIAELFAVNQSLGTALVPRATAERTENKDKWNTDNFSNRNLKLTSVHHTMLQFQGCFWLQASWLSSHNTSHLISGKRPSSAQDLLWAATVHPVPIPAANSLPRARRHPWRPGLEQKVSVCTKNETKTEIRLHH